MKFSYKARTQEGQLQVGTVEAANRDVALNILLGHGLFVLSLESAKEEQWYNRLTNFFNRVKAADLMIFTRQFATLLSSQVPLSDSLRNLYQQTTNSILKEVIAEISSDVEAGFSLSQALERHPGIFSDFYVNMVKSAEITGHLADTLNFLADYLEKQVILTTKVRNALIYPIFVISLFIVAVIIMVTLVFPQLTPIFEETGVDLPVFTKIFLGFGNFMIQWWWVILGLIIVLILVLVDYFQTEEGKIVFDEVSLRLPVLGIFFRKFYVARFADAARTLIQGGLTIPQAVEVSAHTIGNYVYRDVLHEAAEKIRQGRLLSQALTEAENYFPPLVSQLVAIGESTGRLEALLEKVSAFYRREVEDVVNNLVELIQPSLMVIIGVLVAIIFASILLPLYDLTQAF